METKKISKIAPQKKKKKNARKPNDSIQGKSIGVDFVDVFSAMEINSA